MNYFEKLRKITKSIPTSIVDFTIPIDRTSPPTQASSNFITNKEQGDWAEDLIFRAINDASKNYVAVRYGKSDDLIAGDAGFNKFYTDFQDELNNIGKRPDLLLFKKEDFDKKLGFDISKIKHSQITKYVKKAVAGLEIRSSAFLIDIYENEMQQRTSHHLREALKIRDNIINNFAKEFEHPNKKPYLQVLKSITEETINAITFRQPNWNSTARLQQLTSLFKDLKAHIKIIQKRNYLSITPKVEDIKSVYKWAETFNVPHYYLQVFFDKSYGISFSDILTLMADPNKEGKYYEISKDVKNQNKTTIKINTRNTTQIAYKIEEPEHKSVRREMGRGRLLFYITFHKGTACLDIDSLKNLLNIKDF